MASEKDDYICTENVVESSVEIKVSRELKRS